MTTVLIGLLISVELAIAETCEESSCTTLPEQWTGEAKGISLMQSGTGRSVLPAVGPHVSGVKFNDGLIDDFAAMEDEFDDGAVQAHTSAYVQEVAPKETRDTTPLNHAGEAFLYAETLFVIAVFALSAKGFRWVFSRSPKAAQKAVEPTKATPAEAKAPLIVLGGSKNFAELEQAVRAEDEARVLALLKEGGRLAVRQEDPCGCTALHVAAHCGSLAMATLLLDHGAKVDAREAWEETPLHIAARSGCVEVSDLLLKRRADIDAVNANGFTPLLVAGHAKQEAVCEFLLSHGAGAGGISDAELPPLVNALIIRRMFIGAVPQDTDIVAASEDLQE